MRTEHGEVDTSYILFICAGAFLQVKPSDLLAELQVCLCLVQILTLKGRLPIRIKLSDMTEEDMFRILTEPEANIILQQKALLNTEGVDLRFTEESLREIARVAAEANRTMENIGTATVVLQINFNRGKETLHSARKTPRGHFLQCCGLCRSGCSCRQGYGRGNLQKTFYGENGLEALHYLEYQFFSCEYK